MKELFSLGSIYPSDFLLPEERPRSVPVELKMIMTDNGCVRLEKTADISLMYGKYWYRSGTNQTMRAELHDIVKSILKVYRISALDIWLDIACNDGTLLSHVPNTFLRYGIDPADDSFVKEASNHGKIIQDYFSAEAFNKAAPNLGGSIKPSVITSIAMFYDLENPEKFIADINEVLEEDGLWVMQLSYTPLMMEQMAFDNICHEHIFYYTLGTLTDLLSKGGFKVMDAQVNDVNGGSIRLYIMKREGDETKFGTQPYRDVCRVRVKSLMRYESDHAVNFETGWKNFFYDINQLKTKVREFILQAVGSGKKVWGYGASTKGNTLLQYFGLNKTLIKAIAERSEHKWGRRTVGTDIPIVSEEQMRQEHPDYLLILPWHFIHEFRTRESEYLARGGKLIIPCPKFEVIEN